MAPASASASSVINDSSEGTNNGGRITIEEAKTVLDKYKEDNNECEIRDSVTDDELLSLEGALQCIESVDGKCKKNKKVNEGPEVAMCSNVDGSAKVQKESNVSAYEKHSENISVDIRNDQYVAYEAQKMYTIISGIIYPVNYTNSWFSTPIAIYSNTIYI